MADPPIFLAEASNSRKFALKKLNMSYKQTQNYLNSFINYENKNAYSYNESFKLGRIKAFLEKIGNPQENLKCIHVAGSKGKGSTCAFIAYILKEAGFKTGLYTSPHLSDFRERIRILEQKSEVRSQKSEFDGMISKEQFTNLVAKLKPQIDKFNKTSQFGPLSFFEVYTAIAFEYFKEKKVDFAVLETGLGGRLDATNVVNPLACAITPISLEHTYLLGSTLKAIAAEKAGIIKNKGQIVITSVEEKDALDVIKQRCKEFAAKLFVLNKDFSFKKIKSDSKEQIFNVSGISGNYKNLKINLLGEHQLINAATAVACVEALRFQNINVSKEAIKKGLQATRWPARFEIIGNNPKIILDAAHNPASARALKETFKENMNSTKPILVFGISNDKDIPGVVKELTAITDDIILTKSDNPRATEPKELKKFFAQNKNITLTKNTKQAMELALEKAKINDAILVTGSLFVVAEVRKLFFNADIRQRL